jgi:hypothetical protein
LMIFDEWMGIQYLVDELPFYKMSNIFSRDINCKKVWRLSSVNTEFYEYFWACFEMKLIWKVI